MLKQTQDAILDRIRNLEDDFLGVKYSDMINYLDYENAKEFLKNGVTSDEWEPHEDPLYEIKNYMSFAWEKCYDKRGISAIRSVQHMTTWLWLAGDIEAVNVLEGGLDGYYGADALEYICKRYDLPIETC